MKKLWAVVLLLIGAGQIHADEGMWVIKELNKQNLERMKELGFTPSYEQLYSETAPSISNAVVIFGGGCTGITVSEEGLVFTNHHCGYGAIQQLSSVEHDYLKDGFVSQSQEEELPVPGLSVRYLRETVDVSTRINAAIDTIKDERTRLSMADSLGQVIADSIGNNEFQAADVIPFYSNNKYFLVIYDVYRDVRMVFAPPSSIGKFGGDTDNWMWPRQTGDFSVFRVYANAENKPANYSKDNKPYKPKQYLKVSLKGVKEGDFAMIMGYPGRTQRYQTAAQLEEMLALNDIRIEARGVRQDVLMKDMRADEAVNLKYTSKYMSSSNAWKKYIGMKQAFAKLNIIGREQAREEDLAKWIDKNGGRRQKYGTAISDIASATSGRADAYKAYTLLTETLGRIEILSLSSADSEDPYKDYDAARSEERRVGKECRSRWSQYH